jgi:hypothetical protein
MSLRRRNNTTPHQERHGLSRPMVCDARLADGRLSPWRSVLPYRGSACETARRCDPSPRRAEGALPARREKVPRRGG